MALGTLLLAGLSPLMAERHVATASAGRIYYRAAEVPPRPAALVFGAMVYPDGTLDRVLAARVRAGVELYHAGRVRKLIMTGDNSRATYDEPSAMKRFAVQHGVPAQDVVRDFAGFRTYDSCYRAREIFQVAQAVLVTQEYHLPRALFLARGLGIEAVGYAAPADARPQDLAHFRSRELLADVGAVLDLELFHRRPRFLGPSEPLFADKRPDR